MQAVKVIWHKPHHCYARARTRTRTHARTHTHTHAHTFNGPLSGTTQVSRYQKGKTDLDFTEARDSAWQRHQLGHMQVCTSFQTDNHTSTPPLSFLQAGCPSCRPTNSFKALKATPLLCTDHLIVFSSWCLCASEWFPEPTWVFFYIKQHLAGFSCLTGLTGEPNTHTGQQIHWPRNVQYR